MSLFWIRTVVIVLFASQIIGQNVFNSRNQTLPFTVSNLNSSEYNHSDSPPSHITLIERPTTLAVPSVKPVTHRAKEQIHLDNVNLTNALRLENVLEVFDLRKLAALWMTSSNRFTSNCSVDMNAYFHGIQHQKLWATKSM